MATRTRRTRYGRRLTGLGCLALTAAGWGTVTQPPTPGVIGAVAVVLGLVALLGGVTAAAWLLFDVDLDDLDIPAHETRSDR